MNEMIKIDKNGWKIFWKCVAIVTIVPAIAILDILYSLLFVIGKNLWQMAKDSKKVLDKATKYVTIPYAYLRANIF